MLKAIKIYDNKEQKNFRTLILEEKNDIDLFLESQKEKIYEEIKSNNTKKIKENIKLGMTENIRREKIDFYQFVSEAIDMLKIDLQDIISDKKQIELLINCLEDMLYESKSIVVEGKNKLYEKLEEEINLQKEVVKWLDKNKIKNQYAIATYTDVKKIGRIIKENQKDINTFLNEQKNIISKSVGINIKNFSKLLNKVPTLLSDTNIKNEIIYIKKLLNTNSKKNEQGYSAVYSYIIKRPALLLESDSIKILAERKEQYKTIKKLFMIALNRGGSISNLARNIEVIEDIIEISKIEATAMIRNRIVDGAMNSICFALGASIYEIYIELQNELLKESMCISQRKIKKEAARWIIYLSQKGGLSLLAYKKTRERSISASKNKYKDLKFDENGYMIGARNNKYLIPLIVKKAELKINKKAKQEIIKQLFKSSTIKEGNRIEKIYQRFQEEIRKENTKLSDKEIEKRAALCIVYIIKSGSITALFDAGAEMRESQINVTKKSYLKMKLDENGWVEGKRTNEQFLPILFKKANIKVSKKFEIKLKEEIINYKYIKRNGTTLDRLYQNLKSEVLKDHPELSKLQVERRAARWIVYSKCSGDFFYLLNKLKKKEKIEKTRDIYEEYKIEKNGYFTKKNITKKEYGIYKKLRKIEQEYDMENTKNNIKENRCFIEHIFKQSKLELSLKEKKEITKKLMNNLKIKNQNLIYSRYIKLLEEVIKEHIELDTEKVKEYSCKRLLYIIKFGSYDLLFTPSGFKKQIENTKKIYMNILTSSSGEILNPKSNYYIIRKIAENSRLQKKIQIDIVEDLENKKCIREGNLIFHAYEQLKNEVIKQNKSLTERQIEQEVSKWIIYILKYSSINNLIKNKTRMQIIQKTKKIYKELKLDIEYT